MIRKIKISGVVVLMMLLSASNLFAIWSTRWHDDGLLRLAITNFGRFGYQNAAEWPKGTGQTYIFGAGIWVGALKPKGVSTSLAEDITADANAIRVASIDGLDSTGILKIGNEFVHYHGISGDTLLSCIRGFASTAAVPHNAGDEATAYYAALDMGYNPSNGGTELVPGDLPNEPGYTDTTERVLFSNEPSDTALWPVRDATGAPVVISTEDSYAIGNDMDSSRADHPLGIKVIQVGYCWNYTLYQDFLFLNYYVVNATDDTLEHIYMGVVCDADVGAGDYQDDLAGFGTDRNLGYAFDSDGSVPGWSNPPGYVGFDFLESPTDTTGNQLGLTAFKIIHNPGVGGPGEPDPDDDDQAYQLAAGYNYTTGEYHPFDSISTPTDIRFLQFTGPFDLAPGDTAKIVIAVIMGEDLADLQANSDLAQTLYDINFVTNWAHVEYPNGGETVSGDVEITWQDSSAFGADMLVDLFYSRDNGETWAPIAEGIPDAGSYIWHTSDVPDGTRYRIRVSVYDTLAVGEDVSDTIFTVNNPGNGVPDLLLLSPQRGTLSGDAEVRWWAADADGDPLSIDIYLIHAMTGDTFYLARGLENTGSYTFNSALVHNTSYRLFVEAHDADTFAVDSSYSMVTVLNDHQVIDGLVHAHGGCNTVSINPLVYYPESLTARTYEIRFNRIQPEPTYTYTIIDSATRDLLAEGQLSVGLDGHMIKDYSPVIGGITFEFTSMIDGDLFRITGFRVVRNVSGFDGTLQIAGMDSMGTAPPNTNLRWAFRGSDYMVYWVQDSATGQTTLRIVDVTNGVEVPFDSTTGDNWFIGLPNAPSRYLDPSVHRCFYLSGQYYWFNLRNNMTVPPAPGDVWMITSGGPKVPTDGNIYYLHVSGLAQGIEETRPSMGKTDMMVAPNPSADATEMMLSLDRPSDVEISIFDVSGRLINKLGHGRFGAGVHRFRWDGTDMSGHRVASGVYLVRASIDGKRTIVRRIVKINR